MQDPERHLQVKLETKLKKMGVWHRFIEKPVSTVHTADAAEASGIPLHQISKNLMAKTKEGQYASLIIPGDKRIDYKAAAKALNSKGLGLVPFDEAHNISGYPPGGTPSIGYERNLKVVVDEELTKFETFYCGGGSSRLLLEVRKDDVIRVNRAVIGKITE